MKAKVTPPQMLLAAALFLAPIVCGFIYTDSGTLLPGQSGLLGMLVADPQIQTATSLLGPTLVTVLVALALALHLGTHRVGQLPKPKLMLSLSALATVSFASILVSDYRALAIPAGVSWVVYCLALVAGTVVAGRSKGPLILIGGTFLGCFVVALRGIVEYQNSIDPTWRIFGGWVGPNAVAAMLVVGLFLGLALTATQERVAALVAGLGTAMIGFALLLTQSRGVLLAAAPAALMFVILLWVGRAKETRGLAFARVSVVAVLIVGLGFGLQFRQQARPAPTGGQAQAGGEAPAALSRFADAESTREQSFEFRRQLWRGAVELIRQNPVGTGAGSYVFASARPGLTTQTKLTHNSFLQLAVESTPLALAALLGLGVLWTVAVLSRFRSLESAESTLLAGIVASVVAVSAHSFIDSDLHYFGIGFTVFVLMGVGLVLACDAVAPELLPKSIRAGGIMLCLIPAVAMVHASLLESAKSRVRGAVAAGNVAAVREELATAKSLGSFDGEVWFLSAQTAASESERLADLRKAATLSPTTRNLRTLARQQAATGDTAAAVASLSRALVLDPNNLLALRQLLDVFRLAGDENNAIETARRLILVEDSGYFKTRSLPEIIPTETLEARLYLVDHVPAQEQIALLRQAVDGYMQYASVTLPRVAQVAKVDEKLDFGGQTVERARGHMQLASAAATKLSELYRGAGDATAADGARADAEAFAGAVDAALGAK
jgi:O-antigen ligase